MAKVSKKREVRGDKIMAIFHYACPSCGVYNESENEAHQELFFVCHNCGVEYGIFYHYKE
jgi:predicted RNA-binding Zn-ribbon protein involved in translation (DUF1610 family)